MRDILFHGKRKYTGEWAESVCPLGVMHSGHLCDDLDPDTVGQYTGRDDEKGVRIFEGHIISFKRTNALGWTTSRRGVVKYDEESTMFYVLASTGDAWGWYEISDVQVIGNIFDNPELMEGGT